MQRPVALSLAAFLVASTLAAQSRPARQGDDGSNLLFTLTLAGVEGAGERPVRALVLDGERSRFTTGWRIPTPTAAETSGDAPPATAIHYQEVGLQLTLQCRVVGPDRVRASGDIEVSAIARDDNAPPAAGGAPTVATFRYVFDVVLIDGVTSTLVEAQNPDGGQLALTLAAEIQN